METPKLWTRNFVLCTVVNFCIVLNYYLLITVISQYAVENYGASGGTAGLAASIFVIGILLARMFAGSRLDQIGRRRMLFAGITISLVMSASYFFISSIAVLMVVRLIHGVSYGIVATAVGTVVIDIVPQSRRGEGLGYYMLSNTLGAAVGPFFAVFLSQQVGFGSIFTLCIITSVLGFLNALTLVVGDKSTAQTVRAPATGSFLEKRAIPISLVCALIFLAYSGILSFLMSYSIEIGQETAAQFFFTIYAAAMLISRPFTGRLFDKRGETVTIVPGIIVFASGMLMLSQTRSSIMMMAAAALIGYGLGVTQSAGLASAVKAASGENLSKVNSTFYIFIDLSVGIGPLILGSMLPFTGYRGMYMALALLALTCVLLYYLIYRTNRTKILTSVRERKEEYTPKI